MKTFEVWYCAHCQRGVDASEVTFHEQHTVCGRTITDDVPPKASIKESLAAERHDNLPHMTPEQISARAKEFARRCKAAAADAENPAEQPEDGPVAWLVDYGDGSDPEVYDGERPPGVAAECSMTPLYPESVKAERDALRAESAELRERVMKLEAENHALLARAAVLVDALELARGEIAHYFKEARHLGGSWEVKRALDRVDQVLDAYLSHGDAAMQEGKS